jgi:hypothetical protein
MPQDLGVSRFLDAIDNSPKISVSWTAVDSARDYVVRLLDTEKVILSDLVTQDTIVDLKLPANAISVSVLARYLVEGREEFLESFESAEEDILKPSLKRTAEDAGGQFRANKRQRTDSNQDDDDDEKYNDFQPEEVLSDDEELIVVGSNDDRNSLNGAMDSLSNSDSSTSHGDSDSEPDTSDKNTSFSVEGANVLNINPCSVARPSQPAVSIRIICWQSAILIFLFC